MTVRNNAHTVRPTDGVVPIDAVGAADILFVKRTRETGEAGGNIALYSLQCQLIPKPMVPSEPPAVGGGLLGVCAL